MDFHHGKLVVQRVRVNYRFRELVFWHLINNYSLSGGMDAQACDKLCKRRIGGEGFCTLLAVDAAKEIVMAGDFLPAGFANGIDDLLNHFESFRSNRRKSRLNFHINREFRGVFPENVAIETIDVLPWLCGESIVNNAELLAVNVPVLDGLHVPTSGKIKDFVFADDVQVILILSHDEVVITNEDEELT